MVYKNKILIISLAYHPFVGGAEVAIKEITKRFGDDLYFSAKGGPASGWEFDMITANLDGTYKSEEENFNGVNKVYRVGKNKWSKYFFPWLAYKKAIALQNKNDYKIVWAIMANQAGWAALKFKKKFPEIKYLLTLQEGDSEWDIFWRTFLIRPIYKNIYRTADYIQAISNFLKKRAINLGAKCHIEVVPNGVEPFFSPPAGGGVNRLRQLADGGEEGVGEKKIITVSRLVKKNGIEYLIRAMTEVEAKLIILGSGKLESKLKSLTKNLNLENKVEFLGEVSNNQVYEHLNQADVFVRPSLSEGLGNAFLEAMAVNIPVIGTKVGGIPDFLEDGKTGWFCKTKDFKSIAEKINYILDEKNKEGVDMVVANAKKIVETKYNWNNISQEMSDIFSSLLK